MNQPGDCAECLAERLLAIAGPYRKDEHPLVRDIRTAGGLIKVLLEDNERLRREHGSTETSL